MKTKLITLLLAIVAASFEPINAEVINGTCGTNLTWTLNTEDGSFVIEGSGLMTDYIYTGAPWHNLSTYIDGVSVKLVNLIKTIVIQDGVTSIGNHAFRECANLRSVTIGNNVTTIGACAFYECRVLSSPIVIPNSVISIGDEAFFECSSINKITLGSNVSSIGDHAFYKCNYLSSINIPDKVTNIGQCAFAYCHSLPSITIGKGVTTIGALTFYECIKLDTVVWNAKNCSDFIEDKTPFYFYKTGSSNNFDVANHIKSFEFGNEVETIPAWLCYKMVTLKSINIPSSIRRINSSAFYKSGLNKVVISDIGAWCGITFNSNPLTVAKHLYMQQSAGEIKNLIIPNTVDSISAFAFPNCTNLRSITIPNSVREIGAKAFMDNGSLTSITVEGISPAELGNEAFKNASSSLRIYVPCGSLLTYKLANGWKNYATYIQEPDAKAKVVTEDAQKGNVSELTSICNTEITATANYGYHFAQWSDGNTDNPRTIDPTGDVTYTAEFAPNQYTVTLECDAEQGIVEGAGTFDYLTKIKISAKPNDRYHFVKWSDNNESATRTIEVDRDISLTALFEEDLSAIGDIQSDKISPRKVLINGQLFILRDGNTYTATGVKVE